MKRILTILLTGVILMTMCCGCGESASYKKVNNEFIDVTATDVFGEHAIAVLGDSMPHGSQTEDIMENGWVNILKRAINERSGDNNYGFTSIEGTLWGQVLSHELHAFPESNYGFKNRGEAGNGWTEYRTAELLGTKGLGSSVKGATLTLSPRERFHFFCVHYQAGPDYGTFDVKDSSGNVLLSVDSVAEDANYARTEMIDMTVLPDDNQIVLEATSDKEVIFTGLGYFDTPGGVVVNNYSNGGLQLAGTGVAADGNTTGLDYKFLDLAASCGTMIFSLGYNDAYFTSDYDLFTEKINYLIEKANENGTKVIVCDTVWDDSATQPLFKLYHPKVPFVKEELKRFADETNGIYIDLQAENGDALLATRGDGVHPNADGHAMIAASVLKALGLAEDTDE
ncbi:MAG: SGNH/GDSL hydrolase family protein [Clostridia bacterium]|nr:SGNH/GDSL hydrolase family protein [Clostridia bacterium]